MDLGSIQEFFASLWRKKSEPFVDSRIQSAEILNIGKEGWIKIFSDPDTRNQFQAKMKDIVSKYGSVRSSDPRVRQEIEVFLRELAEKRGGGGRSEP